jgi:PhnB protein
MPYWQLSGYQSAKRYHTVTPYLVVPGVTQLIDFVKQAFDAEELVRMAQPDGTVNHAEVRIGDSRVMMGQTSEEHEAIPAMPQRRIMPVMRRCGS